MSIIPIRPLVLFGAGVIVALSVLAAGTFPARASGGKTADGHAAPKHEAKEPAGALSANEYVTMQPFVIPMFGKRREMTHQYVLVLALKLAREDARDAVVQRIPLVRNALYPELFRLIALRSPKQRVLDKVALEQKLGPTVLDAAGRELVTALVVHQAFTRDPP